MPPYFWTLCQLVDWLARPLQRRLKARRYRKDFALARELYATGRPLLAELILRGVPDGKRRYLCQITRR